MMHVVVTGGLGFIGSHLCRALLERGIAVTAVDDLSGRHAPDTGAAAGAELARLAGCRVAIARAEDAAAEGLLDGADALVHLAALPGVRRRTPSRQLMACNVDLVRELLRASRARRMRFVFASTSSIYGDARILPTPESAPAAPLNPYARSKLAAEQACRAAAAAGTDASIARLFTVYGCGQRPDMAFARWVADLRRGRPVVWCAPPGAAREFTYVGDAVRGLVAVLELGHAGEAYNIAGGPSVDVRRALSELEGLLGERAVLAPRRSSVREAVVTAGCGRKSASELGYEPAVELPEGLRRQLATAPALTPSAAAA